MDYGGRKGEQPADDQWEEGGADWRSLPLKPQRARLEWGTERGVYPTQAAKSAS